MRTTNIIGRLNKEFKRRTKSMEIVAGENSCYWLLAFIPLKIELAWRTAPIGRVNANLPFFRQIAEKELKSLVSLKNTDRIKQNRKA